MRAIMSVRKAFKLSSFCMSLTRRNMASVNAVHNKDVTKVPVTAEEEDHDAAFDSTLFPELIEFRNDFICAITDKQIDYITVSRLVTSFHKFYLDNSNNNHTVELMSHMQYFVETHIYQFPLEHLFKMLIEFINNKAMDIHFYNIVQHHVAKRFASESGLNNKNETMSMLYYLYLKACAENSLMDVKILHHVLDHFVNKSSLIKEPKNLFDFVWLVGLSIASILEKRELLVLDPHSCDTSSQILDTGAVRNLHLLLNKVETEVAKDDRYSENSNYKIRLYKALYYLRSEGINMSPELNNFLTKFKSYASINMSQASTKSSSLETALQKMLDSLKIKHQKQKALDFGTVDFFVYPDICIEVNGPSHYFLDLPIAKDMMKKRVLENENYNLFTVSYTDFENPEALYSSIRTRFQHIDKNMDREAKTQLVKQLRSPYYSAYEASTERDLDEENQYVEEIEDGSVDEKYKRI